MAGRAGPTGTGTDTDTPGYRDGAPAGRIRRSSFIRFDRGRTRSGAGGLLLRATISGQGEFRTARAKTADIPEGGGKVVGDVVVTQPTAGEFKAFSSKCTHAGCAVKEVADGVINCPCHGSKFDATDGSVKAGPATTPLAAASITVEGDSIRLA